MYFKRQYADISSGDLQLARNQNWKRTDDTVIEKYPKATGNKSYSQLESTGYSAAETNAVDTQRDSVTPRITIPSLAKRRQR